MVKITPRIEMDFGSGWEDVSPDVVGPWTASWGILGSSPKNRTADPGELKFELDDSTGNSGATRGYYSLGHPSVRAGFEVGTPVRLVLSAPLLGDRVRWVGTVEESRSRPGVARPAASVRCVDWMGEAARTNVSGVGVQVDVQSDDLFETLVEVVPRQPPGGTQVGSGSDVYPWALDDARDEETKVLTELQKLALSEVGVISCQAGVAVFEGRRVRGGAGSSPKFALDASTNLVGIEMSTGRDDILNRVKVSFNPRRVDAGYVELFVLETPMQVLAGTEVTFDCPYRDREQKSTRVGGYDMQAPVAQLGCFQRDAFQVDAFQTKVVALLEDGDYDFNGAEDGTGLDLTDQLSVVAVFGGNSARVTVRNGGPRDGWLLVLRLRGIGLYAFEALIADRGDDDSIVRFGETLLSYDMPYQVSPTNAVEMAQFVVLNFKDLRPRARTAKFIGNWDDECAEAAFDLRISDVVSITALDAGLDGTESFVNGFRMVGHPSGLLHVSLEVAPVDPTAFWQLEVDGRTELDETTVLGYGLFVPGWILDTSELGSGSFLN